MGKITTRTNARSLIFLQNNLVKLAATYDATTHFSERAPCSGPSTRYPFDLLCLYSLCLVVCLVLFGFWKHLYRWRAKPWSPKKSFIFFFFAFWRILIGFCSGSFSFVLSISFLLSFSCFLAVYPMICLFFLQRRPSFCVLVFSPGSRCILMGFFYTSSCLTGLYYFSFFRYLAMQFLARTGFRILTVNGPCCLLPWSNQ